MRSTLQPRLDERSQKLLSALVRKLGWSPSQVVREGLRMLNAAHLRRKKRGVIGLGRFRSGIPDLATNRNHLRGLGR